jgi:hypothetical protein
MCNGISDQSTTYVQVYLLYLSTHFQGKVSTKSAIIRAREAITDNLQKKVKEELIKKGGNMFSS